MVPPESAKAAADPGGHQRDLRQSALLGELGESLITSTALTAQGPSVAVDSFGGWPARIAASWRASVESVLEAGRLIAAAKVDLPHGAFLEMIKTALPFGASTAQRLMRIAADERLSNAAHVLHLPPSWGTLNELRKLDDDTFKARIADGSIRPDLERSEAKAIVQQQRLKPIREACQARVAKGCKVEDLAELADSGFRAGAILADPPWTFETWSDAGKGRSAEQHYRTDSLEPIKALPVRQLAANDSVLHLWCMDWLLPGALQVIEAWGFTFVKIGFVWVKQNPSGAGLFMGMGHWQREGAELCLFATRGNPKRIWADVRQVIETPIREHSRKPDEIHERVERLTAGPYLELFARRVRPGWRCYGDEIPRGEFNAPDEAAP